MGLGSIFLTMTLAPMLGQEEQGEGEGVENRGFEQVDLGLGLDESGTGDAAAGDEGRCRRGRRQAGLVCRRGR